MLSPTPKYQAKSGSQAEPLEEYFCDLEAPEDYRQDDEEPTASL
jgi:hypothetical protein